MSLVGVEIEIEFAYDSLSVSLNVFSSLGKGLCWCCCHFALFYYPGVNHMRMLLRKMFWHTQDRQVYGWRGGRKNSSLLSLFVSAELIFHTPIIFSPQWWRDERRRRRGTKGRQTNRVKAVQFRIRCSLCFFPRLMCMHDILNLHIQT